ncbi:MAG: LLM class flavin-dependent oxidoreductase [Gammaproteobacteria bacterium]|jgi:alkanesulfonate monooxygenase SsuD/methylene tetrahydromethanopterin reductase-like flavin-dependent oxidoreductase (luciferase family)|nr:hypothetical protein [Chromatiales bacterium]MCP4924983.1 LLM class flavin-dependent oxidoreductase [Gammaproteobacteria bacterium]MDP7093368.1 LLM class flavin-dependent oxidoreductase [Gammaproteobacteria bacterium]MDP7296977.1 LLM class flavin-dependent oxidoreductase [Gammaproteobacteria bacterium]MDP7419011.1 LLM class flavin-dependent oxidoreductase [Gammaproteobacteria bacterium]
MSISFDLGILPNRPIQGCIDLALRAEQLGYSGVWIADSHSVMRDPYSILAALAVQTEQLALATGVTHTVTRHPAVLANSWASLQELSGGRAICGIGVGESAVHNLGLKPERLVVFEEKVRTLRALIRGEPTKYEGKELRMAWSERDVPIVMACSGPRSLRLGGRLADGVLFQVGSNPRLVQYALDNIRAGAEEAGRDFNDIKLLVRVACAVSDDRNRAREEVKGYASVAAGTVFATVPRDYFDDQLYEELTMMKSQYDYAEHASNEARHKDLLTDRILDAVAIAGTPQEAIPRFQALVELGVDGFVWPAGMSSPGAYIETFAKQVMPHFDCSTRCALLQGSAAC